MSAVITCGLLLGLLVLARLTGEEISWLAIGFIALVVVVVLPAFTALFVRASRAGAGPFVSPLAGVPREERRQAWTQIRRGEAASDAANAELQQAAAIHLLRQRWQYAMLVALALPQIADLITGEIVGRWFAGSVLATYAGLAWLLASYRRRARLSVEANRRRWGVA